jgi:glucose-1-phosphate thymidylyltransferase
MKGLILSGGKGTRLRPLTFTRAKQLIPIANKPNLAYVIEDLVTAGITDIGVIISPETGAEIQESMGDGSRWDATLTYILQDTPAGLAHAVKTGREFLGDDPFVMYLGDNLLNGGISHLVEEYASGVADSIILLTEVPNPEHFGVADVDENGKIRKLVEKPKDPPSNLALVGVYLFSPLIHDVIENLKPSARGEYEITDAIQGLIDEGRRVLAHRVRGWWKDTGKPEDLLEANRLVLSYATRQIDGEMTNSQAEGEVVVEAGATIINSEIRGPVHIAAGAVVENSYIGPYTSIGQDARVENSEIEYSIIFHEATVVGIDRRLDSCVIGQGVVVEGHGESPRQNIVQMVLGDYSQVKL